MSGYITAGLDNEQINKLPSIYTFNKSAANGFIEQVIWV